MKIHRMRRRKEVLETQDGFIVRCPICQSPWIKESEGDYEHGTCKHLKFVWWSGAHSNPPSIIGRWASERFLSDCLAELNRIVREEGTDEAYTEIPGISDNAIVANILKRISATGFSEVWEYRFIEEYCMGGGGEASGFFGVKREGSPNRAL
jgi:hypothetical protein